MSADLEEGFGDLAERTAADGFEEFREDVFAGERRLYGFDIICLACHNVQMSWVVEIGDEFEPEFDELHEDVRTEMSGLGSPS